MDALAVVLERLKHPAPGSAIARARDYGIDLTLIARNLSLTPAERFERAGRALEHARALREAASGHCE